jgi:3-oxoacyl-[acyl-carrier-protein] synthase I
MSAPAIPGVCVVGLGAQTPVGGSVPAAAAAVRARLPMVAEHPYIVDRFGEPVTVARAPWLPAEMSLLDRLLALGTEAAREALAPLLSVSPVARSRLAVVAGLPAVRPGLPLGLAEPMLDALSALLPEGGRLMGRRALLLGGVAGLTAVEEGCRLIREGNTDACLAGGIESYIDRVTLEWLDWTGQFHSPNHSWGFIPGEAAGFCLLASERLVRDARLEVLGTVRGASTILEPKLRRDRAVCLGEGLTESFRRTLAALPDGAKVDQVIGDLNGQPHRADEFGFTMTRLAGRFHDPGRFHTPAECWGDVGAASGPLFLALAALAGKKRYARGPHTLVWASAMVAERAAALIHVDPRPPEP